MSVYMYPLIFLPDIITAPGCYLTRGGEAVTISSISTRLDFNCKGTYSDGIVEGWHKSGRLYAGSHMQSANDIVSRIEDQEEV